MRCSPRTRADRCATALAQARGHRARAAAPRARSWRCAPTTARSTPSRARHRLHHQRRARASGARIRSARSPIALGADWGEVEPFVLRRRRPVPRAAAARADSAAYTAAFNEAKASAATASPRRPQRTAEQTEIGIYWAYDGTPSLCAPPRLYNQIAVHIADQMRHRRSSSSRGCSRSSTSRWPTPAIAIWESKYYYEFWRPVTGIREADPGTGPTGAATATRDASATRRSSPLGAPASNLNGPNFTPPFPAYPSGHAGLRRRAVPDAAQLLRHRRHRVHVRVRRVQRRDADNQGNVRPLLPRTFRRCRRPRRRTARAASISASTGRSTRPKASRRASASPNYVFRNAFTPLRNNARSLGAGCTRSKALRTRIARCATRRGSERWKPASRTCPAGKAR